MKNSTFKGKLSLKKETIVKLNDAQMGVIKGGEEEVWSRRSHCAKRPCLTATI